MMKWGVAEMDILMRRDSLRAQRLAAEPPAALRPIYPGRRLVTRFLGLARGLVVLA